MPKQMAQECEVHAHRKFIPSNAYPTEDGFLYIAIGNDAQWKRLTASPKFRALRTPERETNAVRTKLTSTRTPDGRTIHLPPAPVDVAGSSEYAFAPRYSEHTLSVLEEAGVSKEERRTLEAEGIIPGQLG